MTIYMIGYDLHPSEETVTTHSLRHVGNVPILLQNDFVHPSMRHHRNTRPPSIGTGGGFRPEAPGPAGSNTSTWIWAQ